MNYKKMVDNITKELQEYKKDVDGLAVAYKSEITNHEKHLDDMKGKYTDEYIATQRKEWKPGRVDYAGEIANSRDKHFTTSQYYLRLIKKALDGYFNAPVKQEFASRLMAIKTMGVKLSDMEFKLLQDSAESYMERRLLNELAITRTKEEQQTKIDESGNPRNQTVEKKNPYFNVELPSLDKIYEAYNRLADNVDTVFTSYCGADFELKDIVFPKDFSQEEIAEKLKEGYGLLPEQNGGGTIMSVMDISRMAHAVKAISGDYEAYTGFNELMDKASSILPESKIKTELTPQEKKLIDILLNDFDKYPSLARGRAVEIAKANEELASLFLLDDRYKEDVQKALETNDAE